MARASSETCNELTKGRKQAMGKPQPRHSKVSAMTRLVLMAILLVAYPAAAAQQNKLTFAPCVAGSALPDSVIVLNLTKDVSKAKRPGIVLTRSEHGALLDSLANLLKDCPSLESGPAMTFLDNAEKTPAVTRI